MTNAEYTYVFNVETESVGSNFNRTVLADSAAEAIEMVRTHSSADSPIVESVEREMKVLVKPSDTDD